MKKLLCILLFLSVGINVILYCKPDISLEEVYQTAKSKVVSLSKVFNRKKQATADDSGQGKVNIVYHFYNNDYDLDHIVAEVDGKKYSIPCRKKIECETLDLEAVMDFDRDGYLDVLLAAENMLDSSRAFYILTYVGNGQFALTKSIGQCTDYEIAYTFEETTLEVTKFEELEDGQYDLLYQSYKLEDGKAVKVSESKEERIEGTIAQIVPKDVPLDEGYTLNFDLNGDRKPETFSCTLAESCFGGFDTVLTIGGEEYPLPSTDRVGILPSKTNGYNDLVLSINTIMVWDGKQYVEKE